MDQRLSFFSQLLSAGAGVWTWQFSTAGGLADTNAPKSQHADLLHLLRLCFANHDTSSKNEDGHACHNCSSTYHARSGGDKAKNISGTSSPASWSVIDPAAAPYMEDSFLVGAGGDVVWGMDHTKDRALIAIGPVRFVDRTVVWSHQRLRQLHIAREAPAKQQRLLQTITTLPVVESSLFISYLRMLHYCLTGTKITDRQIDIAGLDRNEEDLFVRKGHDYAKVWQAEQEMLSHIAAGDLSWEGIRKSSLISNGVPLPGKSDLDQAKVSLIVFSTLLSRTAMSAGVPPDVAYPLADSFVQHVMASPRMTDMYRIGGQMYHEFLRAIHQARSLLPYPPVVRQAMGYGLAHLDEPVRAQQMAQSLGYSPYYVTRAFHQTIGLTFDQWLLSQRVRKAQHLLRSTNLRIDKIAEECGFSSRRYFTRCFSRSAGCSPERYRRSVGTIRS